jgi:hypothetical protein
MADAHRRRSPENRQQSGRRHNGTFAPGCTGNAGARPKAIENIRELARQHSGTAVATLAAIAESGKQESARVAAAAALLDRAWGRPTQPLAGDDDMPPIGLSVADREAEIARKQAAARELLDHAFGADVAVGGSADA